MAKVVGRPDPYTIVVLEGIRLPAYTAGGVNVSVGELQVVDHAQVHVMGQSGAAFLSGAPFQFIVTSGSGNIVTIGVYGVTASTLAPAEAPASTGTSSFPLSLTAYGH